ncbi:uncharacterized protein LOC133193760 isoform X2 [Saccostrea echinata]|uniref:uncharacterized protein LOC133193760 isoform X2 n=1 Tax=Saccostrea echinata TaxID=191078 RepID=UPI002A7FB528|nr:uncharacterized protein LOC133193760 isoform X2 [Saccostrea echinata]
MVRFYKHFLTFWIFLHVSGISLGLKCWHCISKNCDLDPSENYKAVKKECSPGQYCQKVYYSMYSTMDNRIYDSTVRGCAWNCLPKNDFKNCSSELHGSRGCVTKNCCRDSDLCNTGPRVLTSSNMLYLIVIFILWCYVT